MIIENYIQDEFAAIVDKIRARGQITNVTDLGGGKWNIEAENDFLINDYITITNDNAETFENVHVLEANSSSFVTSTDIGYNVSFNYMYKANKPYFLDEKPIKANEVITQKNEGVDTRMQKYPLVWLIRPFTYDNREADYIYSNPRIAIVDFTEREYNSVQRYGKVITPYLEPIYEALLVCIAESSNITVYAVDEIPHDRLDELLIDGNPLPDTLDGIQIEFIDLPFKRKC